MNTSITASEIIEYNFCPRFIYFMLCLGIAQDEQRRFLVQKGRELHENKLKINKDYLRKKIGAVDKKLDFYYYSENLRLRGKMDEVLFLNDGSVAPLDYKYSEYNERLYATVKHQQVVYCLLLEEYFKKPANKAFVCFVLSKNYLHEFEIKESDKQHTLRQIDEIYDIIGTGLLPAATKSKGRCLDCCYRNICVK
ncbi:MAG: CRISPR-associated protein Cas4 [Candidatus Margulisiibacteriota bacterium]